MSFPNSIHGDINKNLYLVDLVYLGHYVVEGGARGGAKRMYIVYRTIYFMLD